METLSLPPFCRGQTDFLRGGDLPEAHAPLASGLVGLRSQGASRQDPVLHPATGFQKAPTTEVTCEHLVTQAALWPKPQPN